MEEEEQRVQPRFAATATPTVRLKRLSTRMSILKTEPVADQKPAAPTITPVADLRSAFPNSVASFDDQGAEGQALGSFIIGDAISKSSLWSIYRGIDTETGQIVAIKQLKLRNAGSSFNLQKLLSEIELLQTLRHPNIVQYKYFAQNERTVSLVLEYVESGSLADLMSQFGCFSESLAALYTSQCLDGLKFLHSQNVIHRNIRANNILITKDGRAKLADFGISKKLDGIGSRASNANVPSPYWAAPELIQEGVLSSKSDIWSLGCTVIELLTGGPPYSDLHPMAAVLKAAQDPHPPLPSDASENLKDFLIKCFVKDVEGRAPAVTLLQHPWLPRRLEESDQKPERTDSLHSSTSSSSKQVSEGNTPNKPSDEDSEAAIGRLGSRLLSLGSVQKTLKLVNKDRVVRPRLNIQGIFNGSEPENQPRSPDQLSTTERCTLRIYDGTDDQSSAPFKTFFVSPMTTASTVVSVSLQRYRIEEHPSLYYLAEVHESGEERPLRDDELPVKVSENWGAILGSMKFVLKRNRKPVREGWLSSKKSAGGMVWKRYYFILDCEERFFAYYTKPPRDRHRELPKRAVYTLRNLERVDPLYSGDVPNAFVVENAEGPIAHTLQAASKEEMLGWVNDLRAASGVYFDFATHTPSPSSPYPESNASSATSPSIQLNVATSEWRSGSLGSLGSLDRNPTRSRKTSPLKSRVSMGDT